MINLSSKPLSDTCLTALSKGLSFVPTTHCQDFDTIVDFHKFFRTLRLKEFFSNHNKFPSNSAVIGTEGTEDPDDLAVASERESELSSRLPAGPRTPFRGKSTFIPPIKEMRQ